MKTKLFLLSVFLATLVACTSGEFELTSGQKSLTRVSTADLKVSVLPEEGGSLQDVFRVTRQEVEDYLAKAPMANGQMTVKSIRDVSPVVYLGDTIMYLVRYTKGWTLHAVDKRMAAVLAINYEDTGMDARAFAGRKAIEPWITDVSREVSALRTDTQYDGKSESLRDWARVDTRMRVSGEIDLTELEWRYDEVVSSETFFFPHLMVTAWHQEAPFNAYSPYKTSEPTERCPVGCVAVALGQFLYHMHTAHGFVMQTPASGSCTGTWRNYTQNFWNMTDTLFSHMALTDNFWIYDASQFDKTALMLGYIGKSVHMTYGNNGSGSTVNRAVSFLSSIGMNVSQGNVGEYNTRLNLQNGYPVILRAEDTCTRTGHEWVCDGYKYDHQVYDEVYTQRRDTMPTQWRDDERIKIRKERDTNYLFQMNWGWNDVPDYPWISDVDDTYYYLFGNMRNDLTRNRCRISVL